MVGSEKGANKEVGTEKGANKEVGTENSKRKETEKSKNQDVPLVYLENNTFYKDAKINDDKLALYENVWRALQGFFKCTELANYNLDLKSTRFMVSDV